MAVFLCVKIYDAENRPRIFIVKKPTNSKPMNRKFKIIYYFLVAVFSVVISYQIYLLVDLILDRPKHQGNFVTTEADY